MTTHSFFMKKAIDLSLEKMLDGNGGPFGAVIVKDSKIIAEGFNQVTSANDPTAHAEITAIRNACQTLNHFSLEGCVIYTSCEPCPMCLSAIYWSRLDKIYYANTRYDAASIGFDDDFIYKEISQHINERSLQMEQIDQKEASKVFQKWTLKEDKIPY